MRTAGHEPQPQNPRAGGKAHLLTNRSAPRRLTYTVGEAAAVLGISRAKAYDCVRTGELRALQFGRRIVIPAAVLDELLSGDTADAAHPGA